jgi:hypothetical protein
MNKHAALLFLLLAAACGGKLTKEEREKLHEGMASQEIRRVTDAEIQEAAMQFGMDIMRDVEKVDKHLLNKTGIDSLAAARGVRVQALTPDRATLEKIEHDLVEAYIAGAAAGNTPDNLQELGEDSLLFTRPVFKLHPDGSQEFSHAIGIRMAKRTVVLSLPKP